jgi:hypothetical protein
MRYVVGLAALLVVLFIVLSVSSRSAKRSFDAATRAIPSLHEDVPPRAFDRSAAMDMNRRLAALIEVPSPPRSELEEASATAAAWAAGTDPGGGEYRAAVRLRGAADELLAASERPDDPHRTTASRLLREAREALASPATLPGGPAGGIRDQLENLQRSQQERRREIERELH